MSCILSRSGGKIIKSREVFIGFLPNLIHCDLLRRNCNTTKFDVNNNKNSTECKQIHQNKKKKIEVNQCLQVIVKNIASN